MFNASHVFLAGDSQTISAILFGICTIIYVLWNSMFIVLLSNDSIVWSGLDMWATGGGCVGLLTLVAVHRVSVSSHSLECLSRTFSNTVPVS